MDMTTGLRVVNEIPGRDDPKVNILPLVYQWLCDKSNGRWLMVLDNADDDQIVFRTDDTDGRASLVTFLPQATHGSILITSRNSLAARNLVGTDGLVIYVQPMNEAGSLSLLRMRIPDTGAYIANRSPLITVSAYLRLFHESESKRIRLLENEDSIDLRRDPSIRYAVVTTWQLSFEEIRRLRPAATDLLSLMSMFDRQGIPKDLMRDDHQDILDFQDALAPLLSYSLIQVEKNQQRFDMHRLVQLSVRAWLDMHQQLRGWQSKSRGIMARVFPSGDYENWTQCQSLLAHARSVLEAITDVDDDQMNVASLQSNVGWYLVLQGSYEEAELMHRRALDTREKVLGREHPDTLGSIDILSAFLDNHGKRGQLF